MTTESRRTIRNLGRQLVVKQREVDDMARQYATLLVDEPSGPIEDSPMLDLDLIESSAALEIHVLAVSRLVSTHQIGVTIALRGLSQRQPAVALRISQRVEEATAAGQAEAKRSCNCPRCRAERAETEATVAASVQASTEQARKAG